MQERRERDGPKKVHSVSHEDGAHGDEQVACVATALRLVGGGWPSSKWSAKASSGERKVEVGKIGCWLEN